LGEGWLGIELKYPFLFLFMLIGYKIWNLQDKVSELEHRLKTIENTKDKG